MNLISAAGKVQIAVAAWLPIAILCVGFVVYCLIDLARHDVRHLPKWAWALICLASVPLGGIVYLTVGREPR
ncbi:MAG TPA: PLD nuclease N-terminal domain-containing protein [Micromonosporaceae bacterium]|nr:PLD nuclease N-terminal domain-containing protein [Micromonosporaceae bacterium]